ncbi:MAG: hypothetical protein GQ562_00890 [Anaerolineales bacterium]|nr:hypothetical protein [Anaerolineales bacterium]
MTDILCPTCGRPNPDDQESCEFCGSPLRTDDSSLRNDLLPAEDINSIGSLPPVEPDDSSRLDDLFKPDEPDDSSRFDDFFKPTEPDDSSRLDDFLPPEENNDRDSLEPTGLEDSSPLKDFFSSDDIGDQDRVQPTEPDDSSRLDDFLPPEENNDRDSLEPTGLEDSSPLKDFFSSEDLGDQDRVQPIEPDDSSPQNDLFPPEEIITRDSFEPTGLKDSSPLKDFFSSEDLGDQDRTQPIGPDDSSPVDDLFPPEEIDDQSGLRPAVSPDDAKPDLEPISFSEDSGWLDMLQDPDSTFDEDQESEPAPVTDPAPEKSGTDWLEKIKRLNKSSDEVEEDSSFPDWLSVTGKPEGGQKVKPEESDSTAGELPDWLQLDKDDEKLSDFLQKKDLYDSDIKPEDSGETISEEKLKESQEPTEESAEHKKFPSWAADKDSASSKVAQEIPEELQFLAGEDPDSTTGQIVDPFQIEEEEFFDDLFTEELPGWLTTASDEGVHIVEDEITPGELPGWVEAMRPVVESTDMTGLSEDEDYIENYGPLAGIPSVLPAEAEFALDPEHAAKKPLDLTATKSHQEYVNLLKKLIGEEKKVKSITKAAPVQTQRILRWLIAIIMIITTGGTIIFGGSISTQMPPEGQINNTGYGALFNQINELYDGQSVLIAFDYQPAATAQMHIAAASVVDHLMEQGTYLSLVSTQPTGPVLAEYFLTTTQEKHGYIHNQQYINLGYLPGESAGLVSFVIAPKKIIPLAFDGSNAWGSPPLVNVDSISDFAMILVITDDPNTAKNWIEQVGTQLDDTPLNMVVSAQAEPLIQPYFRASPQLLSGYVSGVIHSLNYEHLREQPNLANAAWLPYNIGIIITVGTMFIGGLANGVLSLFSRRRTRQIGEIK